ncbi:bifunctional (p)ppGpp synthetase/guanosine-3',5'-bis(diphosphate) 3'-pyrophosphohydrolase [Desulfohalobiaceae bacterium Ax17]|uniref:RelA/SpoT family protein n=1 Tax=Desulfovulcanus ferrireducens TaxID=2831190 RepID=UPI00207BB19D|nr:bifunctional (p)ppGpp synthetase/guanosine-3',5'-bis(diphosphate) 3'-pyrophosphohydrolase [Desulfovulcanus ferrireducens]MBT8762792.1 bifunctional (p)ppGpp synthetase/guanosine-3',5'-bis(diphosphate) 3'-pyrophosphohydrolase [Desulfovulcanus ferrireducens]
MIRINEIIDKVSPYLTSSDLALIQKAYVFSAAAHAGQIRLSGEPYLSHPLEVANILAEMHLDASTIAAGLLHDTVEDTRASIEELERHFGSEVAKIVDGVTKISKMKFDSKEEAQAENIRKMILAMADDIRVIMVKLADRLHNVRTLEFQKDIKQRLIAKETLDIYAPLANRLGLYRLKVELEDLSLKYSRPDIFHQIEDGIKRHQTTGQQYIDKVCDLIKNILEENSIQGRVSGRVKHIYSIYHKMVQQGLTLDQVYDLIAFRVIVKSIKDCYAVLGLVHAIWKPVPGRFKDYISMPKANMYQSLHTTVIGPDGERIEIQIRTEEMHQLAEYGVAAHWKYKEGGTKLKEKDAERFSWLRRILDWQQELKDPREFMASLRFDLFQDEVYVFTPRGEVKELPEGATPVDFAYMIHSEVGDHCAGAKVNGRLVPLNTKLKNGDVVEIITDPHRNPSRDWLKFVKTAKARTRIKHWIRNEERETSIALGREVLEKEGRKLGLNIQKILREGQLEEVARDFSYKSVEDLLSAVGYARITPRQVLNRLLPKEEPKAELEKGEVAQREEKERLKGPRKDGVRIKGVGDVLLRFAKCCNPIPGDPIIGYISRGRGVTIHTTDCPNVERMEPERMLEVAWEVGVEKAFPAKIKIVCKNEKGVLALVSGLLTEEDIDIDSGTFKSNVDGRSEIVFTVLVNNSTHLYKAIESMRKLDPVLEVTRMTVNKRKAAF